MPVSQSATIVSVVTHGSGRRQASGTTTCGHREPVRDAEQPGGLRGVEAAAAGT